MDESSTTGGRRPSWLPNEDDRPPVEAYHVWAPRPLGRSILWTPVGDTRRNAPTGAYEVFVEQRALETMYRHVWGANPADEPFGYLLGDLCEDRESQRRYVVITRAVASAFPLSENESQQISAESARALGRQVNRHEGVLAGWYHRHRDGPVRLSEDDEATHREHFGEPWQVAFLFVTDPDEPAGACFQPRTFGVTAHTPLPFFELARVASLMARGVRRTRIDWQNVETEAKVVVDALPRPEMPRQAPKPVAAEEISKADVFDEVVEEAVEPEAEIVEDVDLEPAVAEVTIETDDPVEPETVIVEAPIEPEDPVEPEDLVDLEPDDPVDLEPAVAEAEIQIGEAEENPDEGIELEASQPVAVVFHAPVSKLHFELLSAPEHQSPVQANPVATRQPEPAPEPEPAVEPEPKVSPAVVSAARRRREVNRERWRGLEAVVEGVLAAAAVAAVVVGAWPLRDANAATAPINLTGALAGFVMPARQPAPALEDSETSSPLALLGRDVRAAAGRYRTVAEMFAAGRLACAPLRETYVEVDEGWTAFSEELARNPDERSEGRVYFDELVTQEVREVEADFAASGCGRP